MKRGLSKAVWAPSLLVAVLLCAAPYTVLAHATGVFLTAQDSGYTLDVGYDPAAIVAGQYVRFDFLLWKGEADTGTPTDFTQAWIRVISPGKQTILATGVWKQPYGPTTLLFTFPTPGTYLLEVSYRDEEGNDIAASSFPILVNANTASSSFPLGVAGAFAAGIAVGALALFIILRRRYSRD